MDFHINSAHRNTIKKTWFISPAIRTLPNNALMKTPQLDANNNEIGDGERLIRDLVLSGWFLERRTYLTKHSPPPSLITCSFYKQENSSPIYKPHTLRLCFIYRILPLPPNFLPVSPCFVWSNSVLWSLHLSVITPSSAFLLSAASSVSEDANRYQTSGRLNLYLRSFPYYFSQAQPWCQRVILSKSMYSNLSMKWFLITNCLFIAISFFGVFSQDRPVLTQAGTPGHLAQVSCLKQVLPYKPFRICSK